VFEWDSDEDKDTLLLSNSSHESQDDRDISVLSDSFPETQDDVKEWLHNIKEKEKFISFNIEGNAQKNMLDHYTK
jgi:hypothetical protein